MVIRIIVAGESTCEIFAETCLVADYLTNQLPNFCYERIVKSVLEWKVWLTKINIKNKWHHENSPLVWKELLSKGSKPYYIGGASEFLEYCHSYYNFDIYMSPKVFAGVNQNFLQFKKNQKKDLDNLIQPETKRSSIREPVEEKPTKMDFSVCLYGAGYKLSMYLISRLMDINIGGKYVSRIWLYDDSCSSKFMTRLEEECSFIGTTQPGKVVKYVDKIGNALTNSDILIIMHHIPFNESMSIGGYLHANKLIMQDLALMINACATRSMYILFANLGPACYNATILRSKLTAFKSNVVSVVGGLGLDMINTISETFSIPMRNIFCPPVWGFVGINHLVDVQTTVHKYNSFTPYDRFTKVKNSTLCIGQLTPEIRILEYLTFFKHETLWAKLAQLKTLVPKDQIHLSKAIALMNVVKLWLFEPNPDAIISLGVACDGSFGLTFDGIFAQPCRFVDGFWKPASDYLTPRDPYVKLPYLQEVAEMMMQIGENFLPPINRSLPCTCKTKRVKRKGAW